MDKPKYLQIKDQILDLIKDKEVNTPIPSEREIAANTDASRMTVRRAVEELVQEGYLYRDKNVGTFIADRNSRENNRPAVGAQTEKLDYKILYFNMYYEIKDNNRDVIENMDIEPGELFLRVIRRGMRQKEAVCIEEIYIARDNVDEQEFRNLEEGLDIEKYTRQGRTTRVFLPVIVPEKYANLLQVRLNTPIIRVDHLICRKNGAPFIYMKSYYNPDHKKIEITV